MSIGFYLTWGIDCSGTLHVRHLKSENVCGILLDRGLGI